MIVFYVCCAFLDTFSILTQKNKLGKIIILYDENERLAPAAATTFVQREVDNVFMLSGGGNFLFCLISNKIVLIITLPAK